VAWPVSRIHRQVLAALASTLTILAAWKLGLRAGGTGAAVIATVLVSLSLWEVEFGRFGRMYAPFQAQFLWYLYFRFGTCLMVGSTVAGPTWLCPASRY